MSAVTPRSFGRDVLGPLVAEYCLRLWAATDHLAEPDRARLLFCARGGLRLMEAQARFGAATGLVAPVPARPLMVSRLVAARAALFATIESGADTLAPSVVAVLGHEFPRSTLGEVAGWLSGQESTPGRWDVPCTPDGLVKLLRDPDAAPAAKAVAAQAQLFRRHVAELMEGRDRMVLVDTGLFGTTGDLMTDAFPHLEVTSLLIARTFRAMPPGRSERALGLSVEARQYDPTRPRTALLRHWHWVEEVFEPALPSARDFIERDGQVVSDVQVDDWEGRIRPHPDSAFAGVLEHLDSLTPGSGLVMQADARRAWRALRRAVVRPTPAEGYALRVSSRTHDFGRSDSWTETDRRPLAALRGSATWREGEIARSGSRWRLPLQFAVEAAYGGRALYRRARTAISRPSSGGHA